MNKCLQCGKEFELSKPRTRRIYCSIQCKEKRYYNKHKENILKHHAEYAKRPEVKKKN